MAQKPELKITGESQITVSKKWVAIVVVILVAFTAGVGWMYLVTATARPATVNSGGYK